MFMNSLEGDICLNIMSPYPINRDPPSLAMASIHEHFRRDVAMLGEKGVF